MLKRIFALILAAISILWVATKALLKVASMAGTIDFLKNRLPSLIRVPQTAQWHVLAFIAGIAIGVFVDQIASSHSWHQSNTEQVITTLAKKDQATCPQPDRPNQGSQRSSRRFHRNAPGNGKLRICQPSNKKWREVRHR
jgi:hypothetical protein